MFSRPILSRPWVAAALVAVIAACSSGESRSPGSSNGGRRAAHEPVVGASPVPYRGGEVALSGGIRGTVSLSDTTPLPVDSGVRPLIDADVCAAVVPVPLLVGADRRLAGTLVWLADIRHGKPLPLERKFELAQERCQLTPLVQGALVHGTLNLYSADPLQHHTRIVREETGETLALVTENDEGQVVPVQGVMNAPALLEVRCDEHPWTRAWLGVFDQPYFAVTEHDGAFAFDSVPPGRYRLMAWHPRLGVREASAVVGAGQLAQATFTY